MTKVKTITSKRQTDFETQLERFLNSISGKPCEIHYSITTDGKDICRSALITYYTYEEEF